MSPQLKLVIGDKNLSSWSMRAWLVAKASELTFEEILIPLDQPNTSAEIRRYSPSLKVPCLIHGDLQIWDSLAICEYIAELAPSKNLWPISPKLKAIARSYVSEMHSGFTGLRSQLSMDLRLKMEIRHLTPQTIDDIQRILSLWTEALNKSKGPFLFGEFGIADAFYAPVVFRFYSYGIQIESPMIKKYMNEIEQYPHVKNWYAAALNEKPKPFIFKQQ
ncbi:glutathione S-transferase family protein [bacterium]|nr:glutathione S-transferase family protein [bacterium]